MKVIELIEILEKMPQDAPVRIGMPDTDIDDVRLCGIGKGSQPITDFVWIFPDNETFE